MRTSFVAAALAVSTLVAPASADAWGSDAHKMIADRAIALLPPPVRALFERHRAVFVERSIDPDTWRIAGFTAEPPNHFLDLDAPDYGKAPFTDLPRDLTAAIAKFGRERVEQNGLVPWRTEEMHGSLRRAFEAYARRGFGQQDIVLFAAWMTHYISDAHQPFHGIANFDGQLSQQWGVHARFETALFERYRNRLTIAPRAQQAVTDPRGFIFDRILENTQLAPAILKADLDAIGTRDVYDDAYYEAFFAANQAVMERRLNEAIAGVAAMITGAWEAAGSPALPLDPPVAPQRRRRQ